MYQWCFAVRGPTDTPFAEGIYHGRILLPPEYPFKPPSFIMLSPVCSLVCALCPIFYRFHACHDCVCAMQSGRFETNTKICLSISSFHPEQWQPSWSMRTALTALIAFFPSPSKGAVGSQEASDSERAKLALESRYGFHPTTVQLIYTLHFMKAAMLHKEFAVEMLTPSHLGRDMNGRRTIYCFFGTSSGHLLEIHLQ